MSFFTSQPFFSAQSIILSLTLLLFHGGFPTIRLNSVLKNDSIAVSGELLYVSVSRIKVLALNKFKPNFSGLRLSYSPSSSPFVQYIKGSNFTLRKISLGF